MAQEGTTKKEAIGGGKEKGRKYERRRRLYLVDAPLV
jgi:hypothetical protein